MLDLKSRAPLCCASLKSSAAITIILFCLAPSWFFIVFFEIGGRKRMEELRNLVLILFRKWTWNSEDMIHFPHPSLGVRLVQGRGGSGTGSSFFPWLTERRGE